jgi:uncharacterized protein (UPF0276 family)
MFFGRSAAGGDHGQDVGMDGARLGFGVAFDLPWRNGGIGFNPTTGLLSQPLAAFLRRGQYAYLMFSYQPRGCTALDADAYLRAYEQLLDLVPAGTPLALHHTALNFGAPRAYDRAAVFAFTNQLHRRFDFGWVNEDIGIWSHNGLPMPYPLPPLLVAESIGPTVDGLIEAKAALAPRLHIEFPGFSGDLSIVVGRMDAYDWFREVAERADVAVTLDIGHLLSYRWLLGRRGEALYAGLDRLPLQRCREIHLSGCEVQADRFLDLHHGVLMDEQIELLDRLIDLCPDLQAVTYEDPALDGSGRFPPQAARNVERLRQRVDQWMA